MAKTLRDWLASDVRSARKRNLRWLSEYYFFRDPVRPLYSDSRYFFAPADGVILYQRVVEPYEPLVEIKGRPYTVREAMRDNTFSQRSLAIGIFMTVYDVHVNRMPYSGRLSYSSLPAIETYNRPMLEVETALVRGHAQSLADMSYLFSNQRMLNRVHASTLGTTYYMLQVADYDVASILPFDQRQSRTLHQNERFSQVRFGSQVDLIIPIRSHYRLETLQSDTTHVEAGIDPLVRVGC